METVTLNVPDISCDHCERTIVSTLGPVEGVHTVRVDIPGKRVNLDYAPEAISLTLVKGLLAEEGYPVADDAGQDAGAAATLHDPVCGMDVSADTTLTSTHEGQTYGFCMAACKEAFDAMPAQFVAGGSQDPVCGMSVGLETEHISSHEGDLYLFCSSACVQAFEANPAQYLSESSGGGCSGCTDCSCGAS